MATSVEAENLEEPEFAWGKKRGVGGKNKAVQFYETFTYDGEDYALYDNVFMYKADEPEPYIGKIVKIWENGDNSKKVKIQWFFRPREISYYLGDAAVMGNELFFASGHGTGLLNISPLEAIAGKCNILCISKDSRNPQPSAGELQRDHYVFYRIFDVKSFTISDHMDDKVGGIEVKYVFNRTESLRAPDACSLNLTGKDERSLILCGETSKAAGKNSLQLLDSVKPKENGDHMLGKEGTNVKEMAVKQGSLHGDSSGVCVKSSKIQVKLEVGIKSDAINFSDLDGTQLKKAKLDGTLVSLEVKDIKSVQSPGKDAKHMVTGAPSSSAKSEFNKNLDGPRKDVELARKSSLLDEKLSKTPRSELVEDLVGLGENAKGNGSSSGEKLEPSHVKDYVGTKNDKKLGENLRGHVERPPKTNSLPNEKLKSGSKKDFQGSGQASKLVKNLNASTKGTLKRNSGQNDADHENYDAKLTKDSLPIGGPPTKKGKFDDSAKMLEDRKNNNVEKTNENIYSKEIEKSTSIAAYNNTTKLKLGIGAPKELSEGGPSKKREDTIKMSKGCKNNTNEKHYPNEIKNLPRLVTNENKEKLKLSKGAMNEHFSDELDKPSESKLPIPSIKASAIKARDGDIGKVERRIFEVTRRPIVEKSNWMKLSWEAKMKAAHDKGALVLLQNLDPEYTSGEVEDIVFHAFKEECTAKTVQHTATSNPYSGQAFVVLKSREVVDRVVKRLDDGCLMLPNHRPLVVRTVDFPKFLEKQTLVGHLAIDKSRRQIQRDMKEAVATSHYSQNNTIEYEMAMAWCLLQERSDKWWNMLYEQHRRELQKLTNNLKSKAKSGK